jgi:uncharacterized protein (DUF305 family)
MKMMIALAALALTIAPAWAEEGSLPDICKAPVTNDMGAMDMPMGQLDEAHQAMMAGMDKMNSDMDAGMKAADIDVAFICGMLPHHQGAIDMAKAELQYGDDPWARELAKEIIAAQEAEIAQMREWLAKQPLP